MYTVADAFATKHFFAKRFSRSETYVREHMFTRDQNSTKKFAEMNLAKKNVAVGNSFAKTLPWQMLS